MMVRIHLARLIALPLAALIAIAVVGMARPAGAQGAAPSAPSAHVPAPSAGAVALAKQILELKHVEDLFQPLVRGVVIKAKNMFMQTNFMWSKDLNEIAANLEKDYSVRIKELLDRAARIYATHFSEPELKQILSFYQSPLGRKVIDEEPKALDESMTMAGTWADDFSQDVINKMRAEMKKRGHDL
jgi:uncharacterized protein